MQKKHITTAIGISAAFYFATYLTLKGGVSAAPILISGIIALIYSLLPSKSADLQELNSNEKLFVGSLFGFALWTMLTIYISDGPKDFYETPARFLAAGLIAIPILKFGIQMKWIKIGGLLGTLSIIYLVWGTYSGGRFSPLMNATKWGNAIAFQAILTLALALITNNKWLKVLFVLLAIFNIYATVLTGTRGALIPIIVFGLVILIFTIRKYPKNYMLVISASFILLLGSVTQLQIVQSRIADTTVDITRILNDDFTGSIGQRLTMWYAGTDAAIKKPFIGYGYDFSKTMRDFDAPTNGLRSSANMISELHNNHHSAYFDTLARSGFIGLSLFILVIFSGIKNKSYKKFLLCSAPFLGFAAAGISDSALVLGITSTYLVLGGTLLKATKTDT
jgi:O-antigen ligase